MAPERQKPAQWLCLTKLLREMCSQPIVHKVLSWGIIGKSAPILAEITIRKSHPLEGSCQEAIRPLYTTFGKFHGPDDSSLKLCSSPLMVDMV